MADDPDKQAPLNPEQSEVLDQTDIDALMAEAMMSTEEAVYSCHGRRFTKQERVHIEPCDFRNPVFLTEIELRQVRIRHEEFIRYLSARLSMFLRQDFGLKMSQLYTAPYSKFCESIPNPTYISLFRVEQLNGVGVLDLNPRLAMTIVDRLLGGKGHSVRDERYLTEIEMALIEDVIYIMLEEWCRQWEDTRELNASIIGRENNGRFLQTSPHDAIVLVLAMEATLGDCSEQMQMGIPYYTIEPVIREMQANGQRFTKGSSSKKQSRWLPKYDAIDVHVRAEWDACEVTVADLLALRPGDVLELPNEIIGQTKIRLENATRFQGEAGLEGDTVVVKVTDVLEHEPEEKE